MVQVYTCSGDLTTPYRPNRFGRLYTTGSHREPSVKTLASELPGVEYSRDKRVTCLGEKKSFKHTPRNNRQLESSLCGTSSEGRKWNFDFSFVDTLFFCDHLTHHKPNGVEKYEPISTLKPIKFLIVDISEC